MVAIQDRQKEAQAPKLPPFPSLHIIDSIGGGKGKSTFSRFFAHHIQYNGLNGVLFDADLKSLDGSVQGNISPVYPDTVDLDLRSGLGYGASDANKQIMNSLRSGLNIFVNLPGSSFEFSSAWLKDSAMIKTRLKLAKGQHEGRYIYDDEQAIAGDKPEGKSLAFTEESDPPSVEVASDNPSIQDLIEGRHFAITRWHLCGPTELDGQEFIDAVSYYEQYYPGRINHVLVRNAGLLPNPLRPYWEPLHRVEGLDDLTCRGNVYTVTLPRLAQPEVDLLNRRKLTYEMAWTSSETTVTSKARIYEFLKEATAQVNHSGLVRNLIKLSDMEPPSAYSLSNLPGSSRADDATLQPESQFESRDNPQLKSNPASDQVDEPTQEPDQVPLAVATEAPPKAEVEAPAEEPTPSEDVMEDFTDPSERVDEPESPDSAPAAPSDPDPVAQADDNAGDDADDDVLELLEGDDEAVDVDGNAEVDDSEDGQSRYSSGVGFAQTVNSNKRKG